MAGRGVPDLTRARRRFCAAGLAVFAGGASASLAARTHWSGTYADEQLLTLQRFSLPRIFVYDAAGRLVAQERWPTPLAEIKKDAGEAFCCISDKPAPPGHIGPPPDCKVLVYGEDVRENFDGLRAKDGRALRYEALPAHRYLVVEYFATWCPPCVVGRRSLDAFMSGPASVDHALVTIDMTRMLEVRRAQRAKAKP